MNDMNELFTMLLEKLPKNPQSFDTADGPGFWSDGEMILCPNETECEIVANFFRDLLRDTTLVVKTGYFDPFEDDRNREQDDYTGFYYIEFE